MVETLFSEKCLCHLEKISMRAREEQNELLFRILDKNKDTVFGKKYGFSDIASFEEYQKRIPYTDYSDYEDLIEREIAGERGVFSSEPPFFFCISSGSLGKSKFFPLTMTDARLQHIYWDGAIRAIIRRDLKQYSEEELFGNIFLMCDTFLTNMPDGAINGVRSGVSARMQYSDNTYPFELYYAPKEVLFPEELIDMQYVKFRFALAQKDITAIHANFVHKTVAALRYLTSHWELFLSDIESGNVDPSFGINEKWTAYVKEHLPPDPERAAQLRAFSGPDLASGLIKKIWPEVKYLRLSDGMQFHPFSKQLENYSGGIPLYPLVFAASEGVFCIAQGVGKKDSYIMLPDACFFEFIPEENENANALPLWELEKGKRYELVVTTVSGLYRYRMNDIIEVVGFLGTTPLISAIYRKGQNINLAGENMNAVQFENAIGMLFGDQELFTKGYCVAGNCKINPPCYCVFIEGELSFPEDAQKAMDDAFKQSCPDYKVARDNGRIGQAQVIRLMPGSFEEFECSFSSREGKRSEQTKPLKILQTKEQISFFEGKELNKRSYGAS